MSDADIVYCRKYSVVIAIAIYKHLVCHSVSDTLHGVFLHREVCSFMLNNPENKVSVCKMMPQMMFLDVIWRRIVVLCMSV